MRYLSTRIATSISTGEVDDPGYVLWFVERLLEKLNPNPDYNLPDVDEWWIEFDDAGIPAREIGLNSEGETVLAGPDDANYGFWGDTNMTFQDFEGIEIAADKFERKWKEWFSTR